MKEYLKFSGATVYDPANSPGPRVRDIWVSGGKIVDPPSADDSCNVLSYDLSGLVVMPGGVDMHCHIAGAKVNTARLLRLDEADYSPGWWNLDYGSQGDSFANQDWEFPHSKNLFRIKNSKASVPGSIPTTWETGYRYAMLGYTTAFDAAVSPLLARQTRLELADTPCIDKGFYTLVGNNVPLLKTIAAGNESETDRFLSWILDATKSYAPKLVNPGGVENWKTYGTNLKSLDEPVSGINTTPSAILASITESAGRLGLPHPVHIHCNQLGIPGNWGITSQTMKLLAGQRAHFTHVQFHSYDGGQDGESTFGSKVPELAEIINQNPNLSVDVGQVLFGETTSLTGDGPAGQFLSRMYGKRWVNQDAEMESGCGIIPIEYKNKSKIHAWQWAIGLQWYLLVKNPWQVVMSTDHPNGGSFTAYPQLIRLLTDRQYRREQVLQLPVDIQEQSGLLLIDREYSLQEIAVITRSGPAALLGLKQKGHLNVGADADLTVYLPDPNKEKMFQLPKYVVKSGRFIIKDFEMKEATGGRLIDADLQVHPGQQGEWDRWVRSQFSVEPRVFRVSSSH